MISLKAPAPGGETGVKTLSIPLNTFDSARGPKAPYGAVHEVR